MIGYYQYKKIRLYRRYTTLYSYHGVESSVFLCSSYSWRTFAVFSIPNINAFRIQYRCNYAYLDIDIPLENPLNYT